MDSAEWDRRYAGSELVWSAGPNRWVEEVAADLPPGRALDLAAGEGRNALWLAERGWTVTAVDFSAAGLARARSLAERRLGEHAGRVQLVEADLREYTPARHGADLVIVAYLQVDERLRRDALRAAADAVAPGGRLLVVAHDSDNLAHGFGGPPNPAVLYTAQDAASDIEGRGLQVLRAEPRTREVSTDAGPRTAIDAFLLARR
ncbi:class I SAM-dependent methyltransferase [Actinomadura geliboluensis]|uniref:Class I SAM-dependent methyltransferase n=1 Tax=Actinomadura geliboluensis TaxID=882440 RepID=A0A5S4HK37_9ACTN|nr:class I SAM-dependent methyltransferase [Actinomadura geliboluensis]TMR41030.1 class I SAM-dependent methyltransferase [Actinomadura geliboluensis]